MQTNQTVGEYVENRIHAIFAELSEMVGSGEICHNYTEEETAGIHIHMALFFAENQLIAKWREISGN